MCSEWTNLTINAVLKTIRIIVVFTKFWQCCVVFEWNPFFAEKSLQIELQNLCKTYTKPIMHVFFLALKLVTLVLGPS